MAYPRFVAVLDVLGMKNWLKNQSAAQIAAAMDSALSAACEQCSRGSTGDGRSWGPLIEVTHFSDTVLAWSPDDSWTSLEVMCSSMKMIVGIALTEGVPLRGSIALGDVVCARRSLKFVGQPIAEAYLWSERDLHDGGRPYRSVGVDITPSFSGINAEVVKRNIECDGDLIWHADCLFVNHWNHGMFLNADPAAMMLRRSPDLEIAKQSDVASKVREAVEFYRRARAIQMVKARSINPAPLKLDLAWKCGEYMRLDKLRLDREQ